MCGGRVEQTHYITASDSETDMRAHAWPLLLTVLFLMIPLAPAAAQTDLAAGFRNPPRSAQPHTWWHWVNGNVTKEGITADLEAMKRVGVAGAQIFNVDVGIPIGQAPMMSERWLEMIRHAAQEAKRLGIELCIHNGGGWSSSGGPWITPERSMQVLTWTEKRLQGPTEFADTLAKPEARRGYYSDIAVIAFKTPPADLDGHPYRIPGIRGKAAFDRADRIQPDVSPTPSGAAIDKGTITDITSKMDAAGRLAWSVPDGDWTILRIGHTTTGAMDEPSPPSGHGLECDKLSREALDLHWSGMMAAVEKATGPLAGKVLNNVLIDSYEVGSQNWTPKFHEEFQKRRGYDVLPFLPVVTGRAVESIAVSERFLWDFRRTICDLFDQNYYGYFAELCHKHGMMASTEAYGNGPFDNLTCGGAVDIPMGEFWVGGGTLETCKLASSSGHTYGRNVIGAESFTADDRHARWLYDPYSIKALGDLVFTLGVNRYIFHRYAMQPWVNLKPGMTMGPWGTNFERTQTWWDPGASWLRYVARCQYLLQSGRFVADVLVFTGEEGPNDLPGRGGIQPAIPAGYDYDGCDAEVLNQATVTDGRITLKNGMSYRVLLLPESRFMTPQTLRRVADLVRAGATVVGPRPSLSPSLSSYPACDRQVSDLANEVWGGVDGQTVTHHAYGQGSVYTGRKLEDLLPALNMQPDMEYPSKGASRLAYIHRTTGADDLYFVSNQRHQPQTVACTFRVGDRVPELWHPDTGAIEQASVYQVERGRTIVPLQLGPAGSVFVLFRKPAAGGDHVVSVTRDGPASPDAPATRVEIRKARYESADGSQGADVTEKVAGMVADGQYAIPASNEVFGDPVPLVVKQLRVEYLLNGKPFTKVVGENETLELAEAASTPTGALPFEIRGGSLLPWQPGTYTLRTSAGSSSVTQVREAAATSAITGPWSLHFPPNGGAPAQVQMPELISWSAHSDPGVRYFSGTAEYRTTFSVPAGLLARDHTVVLDLGRVMNLAEVTVNAKPLGTLWKAPFRVDVTGLLRATGNTLTVKVTNLWPNRMIGDEQYPPDVEYTGGGNIAKWPDWLLQGKPRTEPRRLTFTTWKFFNKDSPLLESGLLGPVVVRSVERIPLH